MDAPRAALVLALALAWQRAVDVGAGPCSQVWHRVAPAPGAASLGSVARGAGLFVAVGDIGTVLTSPDGEAWTARASGTSAALADVAWGPPGFVAVGAQGSTTASVDGRSWVASGVGEPVALSGVTWAGTRYIAMGPQDAAYVSPDGVHWSRQALGLPVWAPVFLRAVAASPDRIVAVGTMGDGMARAWSDDGLTWTLEGGGARDWYRDIHWTGTQFVALGGVNYGTPGSFVVTSRDGLAWSGGEYLWNTWMYGVAWGDGCHVAVGSEGKVWTSPDAASWTEQPTEGGNPLQAVAYGDGRFVAVGLGGDVAVGLPAPRAVRRHLRR